MSRGRTPGLPKEFAGDRLIRTTQAAEMLGCSRSQLYRLVEVGKLPPATRLSHGIAGWPARILADLIAGRAA